MKYKVMFIVLSLFFISGCDATYNLDISRETINEKTSVIETDIDRFDEDDMANYYYDLYSKMPLAIFTKDNIMNPEAGGYSFSEIDGITYYDTDFATDDIGIKYEGKFPINDYGDSTIANYGAQLIEYKIVDNNVVLNSNSLKMIFDQAPTLDKLTVNIAVKDYYVLQDNADEKSGSTYTWIIKRNEASKKTVQLKLGNSNFVQAIKTDVGKVFKKGSNVIFIVFAGALLVFGVLLLLGYIMKKNEEINNL